MTQLAVQVDSMLRFRDLELPYELQTAIGQELWMYNPRDPAEQIVLVQRDQDGLACLPRGYALRLRVLAEHYGVNVIWDDRRVIVPADIPLPTNHVRAIAYQLRAVQRLVHAEQGIYEGPTASGKTITAAIIASSIQQRMLIMVDKINLATQWRERFEEALGISPAIIGDSSWEEGPITIALWQSLWRRREELDQARWWSTWGAQATDECHAVSAPSIRELIQRFPAYFRFGFSATPDRRDWIMAASRGIIGEIVCRTTEDELVEAGMLVKPRIVAVRTPFTFKKQYGVGSNAQWQAIVKDLKVDPARNAIIRAILAHERGSTMLVQTDHTSHADELVAQALAGGWEYDRVHLFTSATKAKDRDRIRLLCDDGNQLVVTTIGKEAMDIPRLDRYMIAYPVGGATPTKQMIGRVKRKHEAKVQAPIVYDIYDHRVPRLASQFQTRRGVYEREGLELLFTGEPSLMSSLNAD